MKIYLKLKNIHLDKITMTFFLTIFNLSNNISKFLVKAAYFLMPTLYAKNLCN